MKTTSVAKLIEGNKLHKIVKESKTASNIAHYLAARIRTRGFLDIKRMNIDLVRDEHFDIDEKESLDMFKKLQAESLGTLVYPRSLGGRARFIFNYDMRKIASAMVEGKDVYAEPLPDRFKRISDASRKPKVKVTRNRRTNAEIAENNTAKLVKAPEVINSTPSTLNINGQNYVQMSEEEYNKLNQLKDLLSQLQK